MCEILEPNATSSNTLGHQLTPKSLLAYAQAIFKASPRALLVSVVGCSFDCRQELTHSVAIALPAVEQFVRDQIAIGVLTHARAHTATYARRDRYGC
jgi:Ni,Fe-hydrogenase maturation factor